MTIAADIHRSRLAPLAIRLGERAMTYSVDVRPADRAWFALGVRKSGSSVFSNIVNALAKFNDLNTIDIPGSMFTSGVDYAGWNGDARITDLLWRGNVYIGFRDPPTAFFDDPVFREGRKILLVRDPRDALVSEYFSNAFSHSLPGGPTGGSVIERERARALRAGIEDYVLGRVADLDRTVWGYRWLLDDPDLIVLKYEEVILDKAGWIASIAEHFEWRISDRLIADILGWADVRPDAEDPAAFVRRVTPGDHLDKLSADTIAVIDQKLSDVWIRLGYAVGA